MSLPDFLDSYLDSSGSEEDDPWISDEEYINDDSDGEGIKVKENSRDHNYSKAFAESVDESGDDVMDEEVVEDIMFRKRKSSPNNQETVKKNKTTSSNDHKSDNSEESGSNDEFTDENISDSDVMAES